MTFKIAIVGRPNVGKSTLFNRLTASRRALVHDLPGMTRDWREGEAVLADRPVAVFDTAGVEEAPAGSLEARMRRQTEQAIEAADLVLFVVDARAGVTPMDAHFADWLRRLDVPLLLVANKCEGRAGEAGLLDTYALGLGDPIAVSAEHGEGMGALYAELAGAVESAPKNDESGQEGEAPLRMAIVGRPNAGKSTLLNALIGRERMLTGPEAGLTRDSIAVDWEWRGRRLRLFDTAGLRRKARVSGALEKLSVVDALRAIRFAEVVILTLDAGHPFEKQDRQLADMIAEEGRAIVIALNKSDLVKDVAGIVRGLEQAVDAYVPQVRGVPIVPVSGLKGGGLDALMETALAAHDRWNIRVPTARLNQFLEQLVEANPPPAPGGRRIRLRYMTQPSARPPTFVIFASRPEDLPESYRRYLVNELRAAFGLDGVPIRLTLRKGKNPYAGGR